MRSHGKRKAVLLSLLALVLAAGAAEGVPAEDEPTTLALRLIDEVGCGRPASLFLALHTVSEHLKEISK